MKTTIMHLLSLFLILAFSASCGKSGSSGGGSNTSNPINGGVTTGDTAYANLKAWQAGAGEASTQGIHGAYLKKTFSGSFVSIPQMCVKNADIPFCDVPTGCFKHTTFGIQKGIVESGYTTILGAKLWRYKDCNIITSMNLYTKAGNTELSQAVLGNAATGKNVIPSLTQQSNAIFIVYYGSFSGSTAPVAYAKINTSLPSILNPVEVGTVSNGQVKPVTSLIDYQVVY